MPKPSSWRDLLKDIINDHAERERIANEVGVRSITLARWASGESNPRPSNLRQLLHALPRQQRDLFAELLEEEPFDLFDPLINEPPDEIDYNFIRQVLEMRATTSDTLLFWTLCRKVLQQALRQLDHERIGMAITLVQCMPPSHAGKIHSLRESMGLGTPPWQGDLEQQAMFLGAESLAGHVVTLGHPQAIDDLRVERTFLPAYQVEYEVSAIACPIMYTNRIAGCLLLSSTQPNYFRSQTCRTLISDYTQLIALAFTPEQFFPLEYLELRVMPPLETQRALFTTFQQRVIALLKETHNTPHPLMRTQAERIVWQQFEEELIHTSYKPERERT